MSKAADETKWVHQTYENLVQHLRIKRLPDEKKGVYRERVEGMIAERWGCAVATLRSLKNGRRRPRLDSHPKFFKDLAEFGRAKFDAKGKIIAASRGKGPDVTEFFAVTPPGRDKSASIQT